MTLTNFSKAVVATMAALVMVAGGAEAGGRYAENVAQQLTIFKRAAIHEGDWSDRGQHIGKLAMGQRYERPMTLEKGENYVFAAACDMDCGHVRLRLYDDRNRLIGDMRGRRPTVDVSPSSTRDFRIVVDMTGCREDECHFGVTLAAR